MPRAQLSMSVTQNYILIFLHSFSVKKRRTIPNWNLNLLVVLISNASKLNVPLMGRHGLHVCYSARESVLNV